MKVKYSNQRLMDTFTFAVGVNQAEITLPLMVAGDAVFLKGVNWSLDAASAAPSVTGAGLCIFAAAISGREQVSPADLLSLEDILWSRVMSYGATGAAPLYLNHEWYLPDLPETVRWPKNPTRELWVHGHTVNVSNAATTVMRLNLLYDVVTLTAAEQLAYLL